MIRLLLADDEDLVREALATLLELEPGFKVVAQAGDGERAVALAAEHRPDIVVLDLEMPGLDGVAAASRILAARQVPVVLLTRHANYISAAMTKLNAPTRAEAARIAYEEGWI